MFIFVDLMGKILLKNIHIYAYHGCMIEEEKIGSDYIVNLTVNADLSLSSVTDKLEDTVDYVTIATTGNAEDFGNLISDRQTGTGMSSPTRGVLSGGYVQPNTRVNEFITIASTGNAQEFGDMYDSAYTRYALNGLSLIHI